MWKPLEPTENLLDFIEEKVFLRFSIFISWKIYANPLHVCVCCWLPACYEENLKRKETVFFDPGRPVPESWVKSFLEFQNMYVFKIM